MVAIAMSEERHMRTSGDIASGRSGGEDSADSVKEASPGDANQTGGTPSTEGWLVALEGDEPLEMSNGELLEGWRSRRIEQSTLVWRDGMAEWSAIRDVPLLRMLLGRPPDAEQDGAKRAAQAPAAPAPAPESTPAATAASETPISKPPNDSETPRDTIPEVAEQTELAHRSSEVPNVHDTPTPDFRQAGSASLVIAKPPGTSEAEAAPTSREIPEAPDTPTTYRRQSPATVEKALAGDRPKARSVDDDDDSAPEVETSSEPPEAPDDPTTLFRPGLALGAALRPLGAARSSERPAHAAERAQSFDEPTLETLLPAHGALPAQEPDSDALDEPTQAIHFETPAARSPQAGGATDAGSEPEPAKPGERAAAGSAPSACTTEPSSVSRASLPSPASLNELTKKAISQVEARPSGTVHAEPNTGKPARTPPRPESSTPPGAPKAPASGSGSTVVRSSTRQRPKGADATFDKEFAALWAQGPDPAASPPDGEPHRPASPSRNAGRADAAFEDEFATLWADGPEPREHQNRRSVPGATSSTAADRTRVAEPAKDAAAPTPSARPDAARPRPIAPRPKSEAKSPARTDTKPPAARKAEQRQLDSRVRPAKQPRPRPKLQSLREKHPSVLDATWPTSGAQSETPSASPTASAEPSATATRKPAAPSIDALRDLRSSKPEPASEAPRLQLQTPEAPRPEPAKPEPPKSEPPYQRPVLTGVEAIRKTAPWLPSLPPGILALAPPGMASSPSQAPDPGRASRVPPRQSAGTATPAGQASDAIKGKASTAAHGSASSAAADLKSSPAAGPEGPLTESPSRPRAGPPPLPSSTLSKPATLVQVPDDEMPSFRRRRRVSPGALVAASAIIVFAVAFAYSFVKGGSSGTPAQAPAAAPEPARTIEPKTTNQPSPADPATSSQGSQGQRSGSDALDPNQLKLESAQPPKSALSRALSQQPRGTTGKNSSERPITTPGQAGASRASSRSSRASSNDETASKPARRQTSGASSTSSGLESGKPRSTTDWDPTNPGF